MRSTATGTVQGNVISLDDALPELDGRRVRVLVEPEEHEDDALSSDEQVRLWRQWAEAGPQGPIEDDEEPEFP